MAIARSHTESIPKALVAASYGIGDILRVTPLARVLGRLGYEVDLLLEPDYPEVVELLNGHPEISHLFYRTSHLARTQSEQLQGLESRQYAIATFTPWAAHLQKLVHCRKALVYDRATWISKGDTYCVKVLARDLGWTGEVPPPITLRSQRSFNLKPGTIALHPGCKPDWPWKKWHGFDDLAKMFAEVALIGTKSDLENKGTYFKRDFHWPAHVHQYIDKLNLKDTAALLSQCSALVSNDSGIMHLGAAVGIPTFGVFGITSPSREMVQAANMFPVTKGLPCEAPCREAKYGRSDCEHHLKCLKTLTAQEVYEQISRTLGHRNGSGGMVEHLTGL